MRSSLVAEYRGVLRAVICRRGFVVSSRAVGTKVTAAVLRRLPFVRGLGTLAHSAPARLLLRGQEPGIVGHRDGFDILIDPHEYIGRVVALTGDYDRRISAIAAAVIEPGDVVADIGAHCGVVALHAARLVGPHGSVHAFEPQPALAEMLRRSVTANGFTWLTVHQVALSDEAGTASMSAVDGLNNLGGRHLVSADASAGADVVSVAAAGDYLAAHDVARIDVAKLDVEGHEAKVLAGLLHGALMRPRCVVFESHPDGVHVLDRPETRLLTECGYQIHAVSGSFLRLAMVRVTREYRQRPRAIDFVAVIEDRLDPRVRGRLGISG
jgi:FkbM family methyltransferase